MIGRVRGIRREGTKNTKPRVLKHNFGSGSAAIYFSVGHLANRTCFRIVKMKNGLDYVISNFPYP